MNDKTDVTKIKNLEEFFTFFMSELKPRGGKTIFIPFNVITIPIILLGFIIIVIRFTKGLGAVTNLSQDFPWGLWIGFDLLIGIALAGGAYVLCFIYYILGYEKYHPIVRVVVLNGFFSVFVLCRGTYFGLG
jgi:Ni/Fe-hydrogenase subunit HybB-like protein